MVNTVIKTSELVACTSPSVSADYIILGVANSGANSEKISIENLFQSDANIIANNIVATDITVVQVNLTGYSETVNNIGSIGGGTQDIDLTLGNVVTATVDTSATTFTFSNPPSSGSGSFTLILTNGGSQTVNWPGTVNWSEGTPPTLTAAGIDILTFITVDAGSTWYGFLSGTNMG